MVVSRNIDVEHMEAVGLTQVVSQIDEARWSRLGNAIVDDDDVLIEVVDIFGCSCVE